MAITVKRNTVDITSTIDWTTFQMTLVLTKEVSKVQFDIVSIPANTLLAVGDIIDVYEGSSHIFGGTITEIQTTVDGGLVLRYTYTALDWGFSMDKKLVAKTYANTDPGNIVKDIISNYTTGITVNHVNLGNFLIPTIAFNYLEVTKAIQKIATLIGWDWYVDADKDLHFFLSENTVAPFQIDDTSGNQEWPSIDVDINLQNMKNSVYVIGGNYKKTFTVGNTADVYTSVAGTLVYPLAYSYDKSSLTVTLGGVSKTIGTDQQTPDSSVQVQYNAGSNGRGAFLRFTSDPGSGSTIKAYGNASIPILAHAQDSGAIATYGEYQSSIVDKQITSVGEAQQRAKAEILQYGHAVYTVKFNTLTTGLRVGQTLTLNSTKFNVNVALTIRRITAQAYSPTVLKYSIEAYGSDSPTFVDLMALLLQQENAQNPVDASTVLEVLVNANEAVTLGDAVIISATSAPYKWGPNTPQPRYNLATYS